MSCSRLSWQRVDPFSFVNDMGVRFNLLDVGPKLAQWHAKASHFRCLERGVAARAGQPVQHRVCLTPIWKALGKAALTPQERAMAKVVAADAVWPADRLWDAGYDVDLLCSLCGEAPDSMQHRCFECTKVEKLRQEFHHTW